LRFSLLFAVKPENGFVDDNTREANGKPLFGFNSSYLMSRRNVMETQECLQ
jgi:hypothetical protein